MRRNLYLNTQISQKWNHRKLHIQTIYPKMNQEEIVSEKDKSEEADTGRPKWSPERIKYWLCQSQNDLLPGRTCSLTHKISFHYPRVNLAGSHFSVSTKNMRGELRQIDKDKDISRLRTDNTTDYFRNVEVPGNWIELNHVFFFKK